MIFDKVYIVSFVKNFEKQNKIKLLLKKLNIENYEFIYGIDTHISNFYKITIWDENNGENFIINNDSCDSCASHSISCGIAHFTALQHAYYSKLNSCIIIEDDVLLYKDLNYVNKVLSYYPEDADIIQYGYILFESDKNEKYDEYFNKGIWYAGAQAYGVCNRNSIKKIIDKYLDRFYEADNYNLYSDMKIYNTNIQVFIDPFYNNKDITNINNYE